MRRPASAKLTSSEPVPKISFVNGGIEFSFLHKVSKSLFSIRKYMETYDPWGGGIDSIILSYLRHWAEQEIP